MSQFILEQAAAFLFVRFFEELVPADMFYAGDIVRLNAEKYEELDINWRETEPGGHVLTLPEDAGEYRTMRGDTPERIGRYLSLLNKDKSGFEEWQNFYQDIRERNEGQAARIPSTIKFYAARVLVREDIDLAALADRLYPDCKEEEFPDIRLYSAPILKINTPVMIPDALWRIPDEGEVTVEMLLNTLSCTVEELGQAVLEDAVFGEGQKLRLAGVQRIGKAEFRKFAMQEADIIGGMLSRFLLQGLTVPAPNPEEAFCRSAQNALKGLYFAQRIRGDSVLCGISYGENGFIKKLDVQFMTYRAKAMSGEDKTVRAPEYYALSPLYQGFISRMAAVRMLSGELVLSDTFSSVSFSDVDMELWANQFLEDIEELLLSGPVKKACLKCRKTLDTLVKAKERLAMAIASQLLSLRQEGTKAEPELMEMVTDRLKRSLKDGYSTDVAAVCNLCFRTQEDERCRLTVTAQNAMEGTQTTVGKAESKKEEIDGYESSKWLRF